MTPVKLLKFLSQASIGNAPTIISSPSNSIREPLVISQSGIASAPKIFDGRGDIIDGGVYLTESDWTDNLDGTWSTAAGTFLPTDINHASWYQYSTTGILNATSTRERYQNANLNTEIDTNDLVCKPFVYYTTDASAWKDSLTNQGDAKWDNSDNSVMMQSTANPCSLYGEIMIPNVRYGILNYGSHVRIKNFVVVNIYKNAIRNLGVSGTFQNIEIENCLVAYSGGGWNTSNTVRAGNGITFKPSLADAMSDIRATGNQVVQCFDACIDTQLDSGSKVQTGSNYEFDNNLVTKGSVGLFHGCMDNGQIHTATGAVTRDNIVRDMGYGWGTYQRASECQYGGYNNGNAITFLAQHASSTIEGSCYNNSCDNYSGFQSDDITNTLSGVATYNTNVTLTVNTNNAFANDTGDFAAWDVAKTCFDPFVDGFPAF